MQTNLLVTHIEKLIIESEQALSQSISQSNTPQSKRIEG